MTRRRKLYLDETPGAFAVHTGDVLDVLRSMPSNYVHCVVTSPPYFGLRDYGTGGWEGGDPECDHVVGSIRTGAGLEALSKKYRGGGKKQGDVPKITAKDVCPKCGAKRVDKQIGLEQTPDAYVAKMVEVFEEVRRVLRKDGTCWLNLGDSYCASSAGSDYRGARLANGRGDQPGVHRKKQPLAAKRFAKRAEGAKHKDLLGIPWMVAFALRAAGWYLRQDIIWSKPNPMPESVRDRCTKSHEYFFLLAKSPKYYYDLEPIREEPKPENEGIMRAPKLGAHRPSDPRSQVTVKQYDEIKGANKRSVWSVTTKPFAEAHFATFPEDLIEPCILAGTSTRGCCSKCGAPWQRVVEKGEPDLEHQRACGGDACGEYHGKATKDYAKHKAQDASATKARILAGMRKRKTTSWRPTCSCVGAGVVQPIVLDPFTGSGTTGVVARKLGRRFVGPELNPAYAEMARRRIRQTPRALIAK